MTFLTEKVPLGEPWEAGYDVSPPYLSHRFRISRQGLPDRYLSVSTQEHGDVQTGGTLPSHWTHRRRHVQSPRLYSGYHVQPFHGNTKCSKCIMGRKGHGRVIPRVSRGTPQSVYNGRRSHNSGMVSYFHDCIMGHSLFFGTSCSLCFPEILNRVQIAFI